jgi:hypothetical protein
MYSEKVEIAQFTGGRRVSYQFDKKSVSPSEKQDKGAYKLTKWLFYLAWAAALVYTVYTITKSVDRYFSKPVSTKINVFHSPDGAMQFPTISLCNLNKVSKSFLARDPLLSEVWTNTTNYMNVDWSRDEVRRKGEIPYQNMFRNSPSWDDTMLFCSYAGVRKCDAISSLTYNGTANYIEEELSPTGKCFRFNPKGQLYSKAGDYGIVRMRLNINLREYTDKGSDGLIMTVHHHTQYSGTKNTGIQLSPGFIYRVTVKTLKRQELGADHGGLCDYTKVNNSYGSYDLESCRMECRDKELNSSCGCIPILPPINTHGYKACTIKEMQECGNIAYYEFVLQESDTDPNKPRDGCDCSIPCEHISYEFSTATTAISREYAEGKAKGREGARLNFTTQDVLDNNIIIQAYFRDMYVQEISMVPDYDFWSLLADVGGMLGLFLGASIFTIIDFLRYIFNYLLTMYREKYGSGSKKGNKKKIPDEEPS